MLLSCNGSSEKYSYSSSEHSKKELEAATKSADSDVAFYYKCRCFFFQCQKQMKTNLENGTCIAKVFMQDKMNRSIP